MIRARSAARRLALWCLAAASLAAPPVLRAQGPEGPLWESYARAAEVLRKGVEAHGGATAIRGLSTLSFRWEGEDFAPTQGRVPAASWDTAGNGRRAVQDVRVDLARERFVVEREFHFAGGYLNAIRSAGSGRELLSYNPLPARGMGGTVYGRDTVGTAARRGLSGAGANMPVLLLRAALARAASLRYAGAWGEGAAREEAILYTTADGDVVTLFFDAATHRLTRREEVGPGSLGDEVDSYRFADYREVAGFAVPHRMEVRWNGILTGRHRLAAFAPAAELPDSLFHLPEGYTPAAPAAPPAVVRVAEGLAFVERLGGGYRMLVADTDEGLLVVDAPLSPEVSETAIRLVEQAFPGRPIRYLVVTHHHADHVGGIAAFAARGATILVAPGSEAYLRRMSGVTRTFGRIGTPPAPAPAPAAPRFETLAGRRTVGRGPRAVEVIDVGPTSHAAAMLAVYVPGERLLFQGDLLRINEHGGVVAAPAAARDLERIIRRFRLDVAAIGAVHGMNGTMDDLRAALARESADRR